MMMMGPQIVLVLLVAMCLTQGESVTQGNVEPIDHLVMELRATASDSIAYPQVLLSLRLHSVMPDPDTQRILNHIQEQAVRDGLTFTSGMLGLYVLALGASCVNPAHVPDPSTTSYIDLVSLLEASLPVEMDSIEKHGYPVTTFYQVALGLLGLCVQEAHINERNVQTFSEAVKKDLITGVDSQAVSALALRCLQRGGYEPKDAVEVALVKLIRELVAALNQEYVIGNVYSTGLAAQALIANQHLIPPSDWKSDDVLQHLQTLVKEGKFRIPVSAAQVLPALLWKSYLDAVWIPCSGSAQSGTVPEISVNYNVTDPEHCSHSIDVTIPAGSTILDAMNVAALREPKYYKFTTERTAWGLYVTSIGGTAADTQNRTYWEFLVGGVPIPVGVAAFELSDGDQIEALFTTY